MPLAASLAAKIAQQGVVRLLVLEPADGEDEGPARRADGRLPRLSRWIAATSIGFWITRMREGSSLEPLLQPVRHLVRVGEEGVGSGDRRGGSAP